MVQGWEEAEFGNAADISVKTNMEGARLGCESKVVEMGAN